MQRDAEGCRGMQRDAEVGWEREIDIHNYLHVVSQ